MRISYVNFGGYGRYSPHNQAMIHIEDRGYQFADGAYDLIALVNGKMLDGKPHLERLEKSLSELSIDMPVSFAVLNVIISELLRRNKTVNGSIYIQVTRGVAKRNHPFPSPKVAPSLVVTIQKNIITNNMDYENGSSVISLPDIRWGRKDIKSISLLPNILAKEEAIQAGVKEAWLIKNDGYISEGSSSNVFMIDSGGNLITHNADKDILSGITRLAVIRLAKANNINVLEKPFTIDNLNSAKEAFMTSTTMRIMPVIKVDNNIIGDGKVGEITSKLILLYKKYIDGCCE